MDASLPAQRRGPLAALRWGYQTVAFYVVLATFGVVFLSWSVPATLLYWLLPRATSRRVGQYMIMRGFRALLGLMQLTGLARFDLSALDALRRDAGLVIAPNHPTLIDALLIASRLPRVVCITKASLWDNPMLGAGARLAGYIRNDTAHKLLKTAAEAMQAGSQVLVFPEGTRTATPPLGPFKAGFALAAQRAGVPVQTVFLHAAPPYLAKGWGLLRRPQFPIIYHARLGRRVLAESPAKPFCARLQNYFASELGGPIPPAMKHLVLMPSYNTGPILAPTVQAARGMFAPVWVVLDGSTDGSGAALAPGDGVRVLSLPRNGGKGAAILHGLRAAAAAGFTHAVTMDADGQHPAGMIAAFVAASRAQPDALILGVPRFGDGAPALRVRGRRVSNWWAGLETLWCSTGGQGIGDSLFGFRVYPIAPLIAVMERTRWMRRFDFDPEAAVRLCWAGLPIVNLPSPVHYLRPEQGGVSHFRYGRDNLLLTWMHVRLMLGLLWRLPMLVQRWAAVRR